MDIHKVFLGVNKMQIYQCPNCGRTYTEFQNIYYCINCNYRLVKQEDIKNIKSPGLGERNYNFIGTIADPTKPVPKCPTCQSTNISKIGTLNRMVSVGLFGLASGKIGKTHKCNDCGSTW